jgi:hypothetical protein
MIHSQPLPNSHTTPTHMCMGFIYMDHTHMWVGVVWELGRGCKASIFQLNEHRSKWSALAFCKSFLFRFRSVLSYLSWALSYFILKCFKRVLYTFYWYSIIILCAFIFFGVTQRVRKGPHIPKCLLFLMQSTQVPVYHNKSRGLKLHHLPTFWLYPWRYITISSTITKTSFHP